jgi:Methyltransferase domain
MIEVSSCVICEGEIRQVKRALVAPFLAKRIWNRNAFCVDLVRCQACRFTFYNPRLDDDELRRLYANYRSNEYQQMRYASEPWYTNKFNADLASEAHYKVRRSKIAPILHQHLADHKISRILDHGGDRGDLVVGLLDGAEGFVYDISGISVAAGVTAVRDPAACKADLIISSNVLEHVGFPRALVSEILQASPQGGFVFAEVPCETPLGISRIARRIAQIGLISLTRPALATHVIRPATLYMMHEHINYFTEASLTTLMRASGGRVIASGGYPLSATAGNSGMVWCIASRKQ